MNRLMTMREALEDPEIFGTILPGESWKAWRVLLIASQGEALKPDERDLFKALTLREREPDEMCDEVWGVIGRRGGKTRAFAVAASYFAVLVDYSDMPTLAPDQRLLLPIMAASTNQAAEAFAYVSGIFRNVEHFAVEKVRETDDAIQLRNGVSIEVVPANLRTIRGPTTVAAICDEVAFWRNERSANPDAEILGALRPSLATLGGPLFVLSSPYAKKGELYATYRRDFRPDGDPRILVAKAASRTMNPMLSERIVARAYERDPAAARAEYGAEFRDDLQDFVSVEVVERCTANGVAERHPIRTINYQAFVDVAGGGADSTTLAIGHTEGDRAVLDAVREIPPGTSPESAVIEFAALLKTYRVTRVKGDRYAGEWPRERFRAHGIAYDVSEKSKSDLYVEFLPMLNSGRADLLDHPQMKAQLVGLERRTARGGRDSIDHAPGAHDDVANAVAGCLANLVRQRAYGMISAAVLGTAEDRAVDEARALRAAHIFGGH